MNSKRISFLLLALVMLVVSCAGVLSQLAVFAADNDESYSAETLSTSDTPKNIVMTVGADETERNFSWYFPSDSGCVEIAVREGDDFPEEYSTVIAGSSVTKSGSTYVHRATVIGLEPETEYVYRVRNGSAVSESYYFETDPTDSFNFIFVGDPQIGGSAGTKDDAGNWKQTVELASEMFPDTSLFISAGDQVEKGNDESLYDSFLAPADLKTYALATTIGNHEELTNDSLSTYTGIYSEHFYNPNTMLTGTLSGKSSPGSDYCYTYNNALFVHINFNNLSIAEHKAFMEKTIELNPNVTWKIVVVHYALFGAGPYYNEEVIINRRNLLAPVLDELDFDVVLNGHEHVYARSYIIKDFVPDNANGVQSSVTDPDGILYVTGASSSGSKYYTLLDDAQTPHIAVKERNSTTFSNVEIDGDSFKITTYRVADRSVLDTFEIIKTDPIPDPNSNNVALNKSYTTSELYEKNGTVRYPDEGGITMTDGISAPVDASYSHEAYLAFYKNDTYYTENGYASITVDLGDEYSLDRFVARVASSYNGGAGVNTPARMAVYVSDDGEVWEEAGATAVIDKADVSCIPVSVELEEAVAARYVQYRLVCGEGVFVMVAEVEAYEAHTPVLGEWNVSVQPTVYNDGLKIQRCKTCGEVVDTEVLPSLMSDPDNTNVALGKNYTTSELYVKNGAVRYPDEGGITMTDGVTAPENALYSDEAYIGFYKNDNDYVQNGYASITVDLGQSYYIDKFAAHVASSFNGDAGVHTPARVSVYVSNDGGSWKEAGTAYPEDVASPSCIEAVVELEHSVSARYVQYRFVVGSGVWAMVAEVEAHEGEPSDEPFPEPINKNVALNKSYITSELYVKEGIVKYPDEDGITMTDGIYVPADALYNDPAYLAFYKHDDFYGENGYAYITVDLGEAFFLDKFAAQLASSFNGAAGVHTPAEMIVYVSNDGNSWQEVGSVSPIDVESPSGITATVELEESVYARYVQYRFVCGDGVFIMVAEVEAYEGEEGEIPNVMLGDVDLNGVVDTYDYLLVKRQYFGTVNLTDIQKKAADVNQNGVVDTYDYMLVKRIFFGTYSV